MKHNISLTEEFLSRTGEIDFALEPINHIVCLDIFSNLANLEIIFCESDYIRNLNNNFRKIDEPTDVLSFPGEGEADTSEVYLCIDVIKQNLIDSGNEFTEKIFQTEILRILIHGLLHLVGYEHEEKLPYGSESSSNVEMYEKQEEILGILKGTY